MKNRLSFPVLSFIIVTLFISDKVACQQKQILQGMSGLPDGTKFVFTYFEDNQGKNDTATVQSGAFQFNFKNTDAKYGLLFTDAQPGAKGIFIDGKTTVTITTGATWKSIINGNRRSLFFDSLDHYTDSVRSLVQKEYQTPGHRPEEAKIKALSQLINDYKKDFVSKHPNDPISLFYLRDVVHTLSYPTFDSLMSAMTNRIKKHNLYPYFQTKLSAARAAFTYLKKDITIPDVIFTLQNGKKQKLGSLTSKYVLLNFWGTWCGPCIFEMPSLVSLYNQYDKDSLVILGIASENASVSNLDFSKFLESHGMKWQNVIAFQKSGDPNKMIINKLGVSSYPTSLLIEKNTRKIVWISTGTSNFEDLSKIIKNGKIN